MDKGLKKEKLKFVREHAGEITPIIKDREVVDEISAGGGENVTEGDLEGILEQYETKFFSLEKKESSAAAKRVLVTAEDPGAYNVIRSILSELEKDERCGAVGALVSGLADKSFEKDFNKDFVQIRKSESLMEDMLSITDKKPFDIILGTLSGENGPESVALYGGKNNLGASKLFVITEGWGTLGSSFGPNKANMEKIDGIFCEDELAKKMTMKEIPEFDESRIYVTGTPIVDTLKLEKADLYREEFRKEFGINNEGLVIAYLATISSAYGKFGADPQMEQKAFELSLQGLREFIDKNTKENRRITIALKTHPRDPFPDGYAAIFDKYKGNPNIELKIMPRGYDIHKLSYGADIIMGTMSTELFLAPLRGKKAVFLGYSDKGLGGEVLKNMHGVDIADAIKRKPMTSVISSVNELAEDIKKYIDSDKDFAPQANGDSAKRILDIVFKKSNEK